MRSVFRITLNEDQKKDVHGHPLTYLPGVRGELEEQGAELRISVGILDQALLEAGTIAGGQRPLDYLLPCWKRVQRLYKGFRKAHDDDPKYSVVQEARRLCISYCVFAITMPEMFGFVLPDIDKWPHVRRTWMLMLQQGGVDRAVAAETLPSFG